MADVNIKVVNAYFNDIAKLNDPKFSKVKDKIAADISNDGKIDATELEAEKQAFKDAGGTEAEFGKIMNNVLGIKDVSSAGFSPTAINFKTSKDNNTEVTNDKNSEFKKSFNLPPFDYNTSESRDISRSIMQGAKTTIKDTGLAVQVNPKTKVIYMAPKDKEKIEIAKGLQKELGVKVDGYIGPQTLKALIEQHKEALEKGDSAKIAKLADLAEKLGLDKAFGEKPVLGENLSTLFKGNVKVDDTETVTTDNPSVSNDITPREPEKLPTDPNAGGVSAKSTPVTVSDTQLSDKDKVLTQCFDKFLKSGSPHDLKTCSDAALASGANITEEDIGKFIHSKISDVTNKTLEEAFNKCDFVKTSYAITLTKIMDPKQTDEFLNKIKSSVVPIGNGASITGTEFIEKFLNNLKSSPDAESKKDFISLLTNHLDRLKLL